MLMLTAYFDEAGHPDDPALKYIALAGFVAPASEWEVFEHHWTATLRNARLNEPFHMKEFAHSTGQFTTWKGKEEKRRLLFGRLVEVIRNTRAMPIGAAVSLLDFRSLTPAQQSSFLDPYYVCFQTCVQGAGIEAIFERPEEKVAMVFSHHPEFSGRAAELWNAIKDSYEHGNRMDSYAVSAPEEVVQLQAADLFAYELLHEFDNRILEPNCPMRWGMREILRMSRIDLPRIRLFDRKELLRTIKENSFPDQTSVEEIERTQMISAMESMLKWVRERANISDADLVI